MSHAERGFRWRHSGTRGVLWVRLYVSPHPTGSEQEHNGQKPEQYLESSDESVFGCTQGAQGTTALHLLPPVYNLMVTYTADTVSLRTRDTGIEMTMY